MRSRRILFIHDQQEGTSGAAVRVDKVRGVLLSVTGSTTGELRLLPLRGLAHPARARLARRRRPGGAGFMALPITLTRRSAPFRALSRFLVWIAGSLVALRLRPEIVVGETHNSWSLVRAIKQARPRTTAVVDLHGAAPEELAHERGDGAGIERRIARENRAERELLLKADWVVCQSEAMIRHLRLKHSLALPRLFAFQCASKPGLFRFDAERRAHIRRRLRVPEEAIVFVYSGAFQGWQCVDSAVGLFQRYLASCDERAHFLVLSRDDSRSYEELSRRLGIPSSRIHFLRVDYDEVWQYLSASDLGLLLRDNSLMNIVASPTKLGEYLMCGLPVITGEVARSWEVCRLHPECFCVVDSSDLAAAAREVKRFAASVSIDRGKARERAIEVATALLNNDVEEAKLLTFFRERLFGPEVR